MYYYPPPEFYVRPKWYRQRPIDRVRRIIERLSVGTVIRRDDAENLAYRLAKRICGVTGCIPRNVVGIAIGVAGGQWLYSGEFIYGSGPYAYKLRIPIKSEYTKRKCFWCGRHLYASLGHPAHHWHCGSRTCREIDAVRKRRHGTIKIGWRTTLDIDEQKTRFLAKFFVIKQKQLMEKL